MAEMNSAATTTCSTCHGTGKVPVPEHLSALLPILKDKPDSTVKQVWEAQQDDISEGAISGRLVELVEIGLATRRRVGKFFHYSITQ